MRPFLKPWKTKWPPSLLPVRSQPSLPWLPFLTTCSMRLGPERTGTRAIGHHVSNVLIPPRPRKCQALTPAPPGIRGPDFAEEPQDGPLDPTTTRRPLSLAGPPSLSGPPIQEPKEERTVGAWFQGKPAREDHGYLLTSWTHTSLSHSKIHR